jgi:hypothetical protein
MVAADDVASSVQRHRLGLVVGLLPRFFSVNDAAHRDLDRRIIGDRTASWPWLRTAPRAQQALELAARLQILETAQRRDHPLAHLVARASAFDDLQISASG